MTDEATPLRPPRVACPICRRPVTPEWRPFCSARCRDVDLNRWLAGHYRIPGDPVDPALGEADVD